eukprot:scaffold21013_cov63-Phaeocystis_antarctica.AAC.6
MRPHGTVVETYIYCMTACDTWTWTWSSHAMVHMVVPDAMSLGRGSETGRKRRARGCNQGTRSAQLVAARDVPSGQLLPIEADLQRHAAHVGRQRRRHAAQPGGRAIARHERGRHLPRRLDRGLARLLHDETGEVRCEAAAVVSAACEVGPGDAHLRAAEVGPEARDEHQPARRVVERKGRSGLELRAVERDVEMRVEGRVGVVPLVQGAAHHGRAPRRGAAQGRGGRRHVGSPHLAREHDAALAAMLRRAVRAVVRQRVGRSPADASGRR